jgi:hypothetical protein
MTMEKKAPSPDAMTLNPTTDDLAFRAVPDLNAALLHRLTIMTPLRSLEAREATQAKLGVEGQWLQVETFEGEQGYVAAWYLQAAEAVGPNLGIPEGASAPESLPASPAASLPLVVKVTTDQLALRTEPGISETNLLLRLPLGASLTVLEPQAERKLGVVDQWLKVKDAAGHEGYVAAWYVSL